MGTRQERVIRSWSKDEMGALLEAIYPLVFERTPTRTEAELLLAHLWLETGGNVINNNFGNISVAGFYDGEEKFISDTDYWRPPWYDVQPDAPERYQRLHEAMLAGQAPSAFRSYSLPDAGMQDYLGLLKRRYPGILSAARAGDADRMGKAIVSEGYTPDAPASTGDSLTSLQREFQEAGIFEGLPSRLKTGLGGFTLGFIGALTGATILIWREQKKTR